MPTATRTIEVAAPIDTVLAFFTNPANDMKWRSAVKEMSADGEPHVAATVHQVIAGPGGRSIAADIEITEFEPPTRYAFRTVSGPVRPVGSYSFASTGDGTRVAFRLDAEVAGFKKLIMGGAVQKSMDAEMVALDKAKAILES